ncbi:MAG: lysozyme inhibitor LprI family protein, partial [Hyphomicrobiaceae bacterium]
PALAESEPQIDCANASSTLEMNFCADKDFTAADKALNAAYQRALKAVPGMADGASDRFSARNWEKALRDSQRAWLAYRDAECREHIPMFWGGGTGTTVAVIGCLTALTNARTKELRESYDAR